MGRGARRVWHSLFTRALSWARLLNNRRTGTQWAQNACITFVQRRHNVFDVGPTLYKSYTNVLFLLGGIKSAVRAQGGIQVGPARATSVSAQGIPPRAAPSERQGVTLTRGPIDQLCRVRRVIVLIVYWCVLLNNVFARIVINFGDA